MQTLVLTSIHCNAPLRVTTFRSAVVMVRQILCDSMFCSATKACFVHICRLIVSHYYCDGDDKTDGMTIPNLDFFFGNFYFFDNLGYRF